MIESPAFDEEMLLPAEREADRFLRSMPEGCTLETTTRLTEAGWEATACLEHADDSPKPCYVGQGSTETAALIQALDYARRYWADRQGTSAIYANDEAFALFLSGSARATGSS
ncbi:hypothetical protein [Sphingopyxis sp. GW247-27LB]|uniref:hypothetical protein n=1 Tax=Sphingopyxis sp. GW247-27LB TaxID=2012632 RepID=UPI000BA5D03D|nr:hypothetical protein [Sphingopyxis sp. GW247-27LB]PAL25461.1 hypothetical protein CD928_03025 [Sphingopyxis sp. GW247-27LB]